MLILQIQGKEIDLNSKTFIIAEAGVNHNGDLDLAKKMVNAAFEAKADAIKFQTFKTENLIIKNTPKAEYQKNSKHPNEDFYDLLKRLEFSYSDFRELYKYCKSGIPPPPPCIISNNGYFIFSL